MGNSPPQCHRQVACTKVRPQSQYLNEAGDSVVAVIAMHLPKFCSRKKNPILGHNLGVVCLMEFKLLIDSCILTEQTRSERAELDDDTKRTTEMEMISA